MLHIGDFFELGFTRAGAFSARPCHFSVKHRTYAARMGQSSLHGVSKSSCARRDVCSLAGGATVFLPFSKSGARGAPRGAGSPGVKSFSVHSPLLNVKSTLLPLSD
jgi:hypothetical protein